MSADWLSRLEAARVMPIVSVRDVDSTVALVDDLAAAGAGAVEILLRNVDAPEVLRLSRRRHPGLLFAAGTVVNEASVRQAVDAGADFLVSPGFTPALAEAAAASGLPFVPGVQTASEVLAAVERGLSVLKFYPAEPANAPVVLKDFGSVFPGVRFVPTGGIGEATLPRYAALGNVVAVGGSWLHAGLEPGGARRAAIAAAVARARSVLGPFGSAAEAGR